MQNRFYYILGGVVVLLCIIGIVWFFFFRSTASISTNSTGSSGFNVNIPSATNTTPAPTDTNGSQTINTTTSAQQKIFQISQDPVVGATLMQTLRPTTTIARFIRQDDGHVYDVPLGVSGVVPKVVSNITIPGGQRAIWLEGGNAAIMQYVDDSMTVKTVYMGFPHATTTNTATLPTRITFLPDNLIDIAASPDGKSVAYLIKTANGSDGYVAKDDGTASKKLFSLPLVQVLLSWPSQGTLLAESKSAVGVTGIAFSINASTGVATELVTAPGLTALADKTFANILYQTADGNSNNTYLYSTKNNSSSISPIPALPEKCIWSNLVSSEIFCADAPGGVSVNYLDLWHRGVDNEIDYISEINFANQTGSVIAALGTKQGGAAADILEMALSPDEHYLSYTTKGDRSLWGVLLQ